MRVIRTLYTSEVVEIVRNQGIEVTHNYRDKVGAIPLPVTMSMALGNHIALESKRDFLFRLYSDYPFPWRKDGGPRDDFEKRALEELHKTKTQLSIALKNAMGKRFCVMPKPILCGRVA